MKLSEETVRSIARNTHERNWTYSGYNRLLGARQGGGLAQKRGERGHLGMHERTIIKQEGGAPFQPVAHLGPGASTVFSQFPLTVSITPFHLIHLMKSIGYG